MRPRATRPYRLLLRLLPRELRESFGDDIEAEFADAVTLAAARGRLALLGAWTRGTTDVLVRATYEHWRRRGRWPSLEHRFKERRMRALFSDLRFAARSFARQPGATMLVVVTLGLAVAANTAVFALLDGIFFRPLPFRAPNELVYLNEQAPRWNLEFTGINYQDFDTWRSRSHAFQSMALWGGASLNLGGVGGGESGRAERVQGSVVTYDFPTVLGIRPLLGRTFTADEDRPKGPHVVVIGYALWQSHFGGAPDVIGKTLRIDSAPYTVVGVLPPEGSFPGDAQLWLPMQGDPKSDNSSYSWDGVARLKPGVSLAQAGRDLQEAHRPVWLKGDTAHIVSPRIMPLRDRLVADYRVVGKALGAGVALVLLIACANVAGAMLARSIFRRREIGIRMALGASGARVRRQLLTESMLLAVIAGIAGTLVGAAGLRMLIASSPDLVPPWAQLGVGARTVVFSCAIVIVTAALFGLGPALQLERQRLAATLVSGGVRTSGSMPERRMLNALVVTEIALAAVLLTSGGLLLQAYANLRNVDPGFRPAGVAAFRVALPHVSYPNGSTQLAFYDRLIERLQSLPGADHAGAVTCPPFGCHWGNFWKAEGAPPLARNEQDPVTLIRYATPDYFATMGIRLAHGRLYAPHEGNAHRGFRPVVVNEELAHRLWPGVADPTGKRLETRGDTSANWSTVVGVVQDVKHYGLARPMIPGLYMPLTRIDSTDDEGSFAFVVHTSRDPMALFQAIRAAVRELDRDLPVYQLTTMQTALDKSMAPQRMIAFALAAFAAIALTLAVGGIYAVLSYVVGRRRHEIGIRMALGAQPAQVLRLVVRQGLWLVGGGLMIGLPVAWVASRGLASLLIGVTAHNPTVYLTVAIVLGATGAMAAGIPARRAAAVEPKVVLSEGS